MILPKIALKNLTRQKRRSFLIGGALAFGILVLTLSNGVLNGFMHNLQTNWSGLSAADIFITEVTKGEKGRLIFSFTDDAKLLAAIQHQGFKPENLSRRSVLEIGGNLVYNGESVARALTGISWTDETKLPTSLNLVAGSADNMKGTNGLVIGLTSAEKLGLIPTKEPDYKTLKAWGKISPTELASRKTAWTADREAKLKKAIGETILVTLPTINGQQNLGEFQLRGIFQAQFDIFAYTDKTYLNQLMTLPETGYTRIGLKVDNFDTLQARTLALYDELKTSYNVVPLTEVADKPMDTIVNDLKKQKWEGSKLIISNVENEMGTFKMVFGIIKLVTFAFVMLLMLVIMVGITNTFRIVVFERTREIGTMRALGMQRNQVRNVFILEALFLSLAGMLGGLIIGMGILFGIGLIPLDVLAELSFFFDKGHIRPVLEPGLFVFTIFTVLLLTLLAALVPARRAAKLSPALALRTQF